MGTDGRALSSELGAPAQASGTTEGKTGADAGLSRARYGYGTKRAAHLPPWQRQPPPQSIVPFSQLAVQETAAQLGALERATHAVGWQHVAAMQSASDVHASVPETTGALDEGCGAVSGGALASGGVPVAGSEVVGGGTSGVPFGEGEGEHATSTSGRASDLRIGRS